MFTITLYTEGGILTISHQDNKIHLAKTGNYGDESYRKIINNAAVVIHFLQSLQNSPFSKNAQLGDIELPNQRNENSTTTEEKETSRSITTENNPKETFQSRSSSRLG